MLGFVSVANRRERVRAAGCLSISWREVSLALCAGRHLSSGSRPHHETECAAI